MAKSYRNANLRVTRENNTNQEGVVVYTIADIENKLRDWAETAGITYWFIEHPADDEVSKTHYHIVIKFKSPTPFERIKTRFPYGDIENTRNLKASIQYLIHLNDKSKVQYDWGMIHTNCLDMTPYKVLTNSQQAITLQSVYEAIERGEIREYNLFNEVPIELYAGNKTKLENALIYYREKVCMIKDRNITVMFISGSTGTGKTTFAKKYCEEREDSYCISSSSNDPLQDYKGEEVLILDDLRGDSFKFHDLLKLLDNHTLSSSKSRYHNKPFIGNMIIITSTKPLQDWYYNESSEDKHQLYRRIKYLYKFSPLSIQAYVYDEKHYRYDLAATAVNTVIDEAQKRKCLAAETPCISSLKFVPVDENTAEEDPINYKEKCKKKVDEYLTE